MEALDQALLQSPSDPAVRAELHFSKGNQLREMNQLDQAFQVRPPRTGLDQTFRSAVPDPSGTIYISLERSGPADISVQGSPPSDGLKYNQESLTDLPLAGGR